MVRKPKVSVVMGVYNEENNIKNTIDNLLAHCINDIEIIIIDDGSNDNTTDIIRGIDDDRIVLIENIKNQGLPFSLNKGIDYAKGEYIARMDADDVSIPGRFIKQSNILDKKPEKKVVGCWCGIIDSSDKRIGIRKYSTDRNDTPSSFKESFDGPAHSSVMIRRSALLKVGGYREEFQYAQDIDLWIRMAREFGDNFIHIIPEVLHYVRKTIDHFTRKSAIKGHYSSFAGKKDVDKDEMDVINIDQPNYNIFQKKEIYYKEMKKMNYGENSLRYNKFRAKEAIYRNMSRAHILFNLLT